MNNYLKALLGSAVLCSCAEPNDASAPPPPAIQPIEALVEPQRLQASTDTREFLDEQNRAWLAVGDTNAAEQFVDEPRVEEADLAKANDFPRSPEDLAERIAPLRVENGKVYKLATPPVDLARRILSESPAPVRSENSGDIQRVPTADLDTQSVFYENIDDRYFETAQTSFPQRATGRFTGTGCTAAFVGPRTIVSAAHCFYDRPNGRWLSPGNFQPGRNSTAPTTPWGTWTIVSFYVPTVFATKGPYADQSDWDFAVIELAIDPGYVGSPGWYGLSYSIVASGFIRGYPSDLASPNVQQWAALGPMTGSTGQKYKHKIDTATGNSGSALMIVSNVNNLAGVHIAGGSSFNLARKWDTSMYNFVRDYSTAW